MKKKINIRTTIIIRVILSAMIILIGVLGYVFQDKIESWISGDQASLAEGAEFEMYVIDVGQGDSILLRFSDEKTMLIDCGKKSATSKLGSFLEEKNITTINYLVYTHADEDHIGGGQYVFENYDVEILYRPKILSKTENITYGNSNNYAVKDTLAYDGAIMYAYSEEGCEIRYSFEGEEIVGMDYSVKFLNPDKDKYTESNSYSAVLMVETFGRKVLLTGDAESDIESRLIEDYGSYLNADILKVAHHGSKTASSAGFLKAVSPDYALISVGTNQWDMPHQEVLDRLYKAKVYNVATTLESGSIFVGIHKNGKIYISTFSGQFKLDLPIFFAVLGVCLLLVWGIWPVKGKKNKKISLKSKEKAKN